MSDKFSSETLKAAFADATEAILPPGSMTLESANRVAVAHADAWEAETRENGYNTRRLEQDIRDRDRWVAGYKAEIAELRGTCKAALGWMAVHGPSSPDEMGRHFVALSALEAALR